MGEVIMAIKAANDEYLNIKAIISQVTQVAMPTIQLTASNIPKVVAIPLSSFEAEPNRKIMAQY